MKYLPAILALSLSGCASQTFYRTGQGEKGAVAVKAFQNYGDLVGNVHYNTMTGEFSVEQPTAPVPVQVRVLTDKNGDVIGIEQTPMLAGVYNSRVNDSTFGGINKVIRGVGSLAGTVLSGMMGLAAVTGATQSAIVSSNNAAKVSASNNATKIGLAQEANKVPLAQIAAP